MEEMSMRKPSAIAGSAVFFLAAPCVIAGLVPWLITRWQGLTSSLVLIVLGAAIIIAGVAVLLHAFTRFAVEGSGTPAPVAPTETLVVGGIYRHVRNPMYVAVIGIILGQFLLFASPALALYAALVAAAMVGFVRVYEEPTLARRYGSSYETYRRNVPGWLPRITPWRG
jgi:protein-S-isoprenylcysteine O-methyltransferase Ste14